MDQETFSLMFAMLALLCWAAIIAIGAGALIRRKSPDAFASLRYDIGRLGLVFAWIIALTTTLGSLYYSKVVGYVPCLPAIGHPRHCCFPTRRLNSYLCHTTFSGEQLFFDLSLVDSMVPRRDTILFR